MMCPHVPVQNGKDLDGRVDECGDGGGEARVEPFALGEDGVRDDCEDDLEGGEEDGGGAGEEVEGACWVGRGK